ncbi:CHY zinc finger protein [Saliphagus sp. GCM10025334]
MYDSDRNVLVRGVDLDAETRCAHYRSDRDVVALRFGCCGDFFACYQCHEAVTDHEAVPWPRDRFDEPAVYCGACGSTMTAPEYLDCEHTCSRCGALFNPGCRRHVHLYFEGVGSHVEGVDSSDRADTSLTDGTR